MKDVRFSPEAVQDLDEIWQYIYRRGSAESARRWTDKIVNRALMLSKSPLAGRAADELEPGWRVWQEGEYMIYHRVCGEALEVSRVIHGRRDQRRAIGQEEE